VLTSLEAYQEYLDAGDCVELASLTWAKTYQASRSSTPELRQNAYDFKALQAAFAANGNRKLYLVNPTIQLALCHHLDDEISKQLSVATNKATAAQLTGASRGILPMAQARETVQHVLAIGELFGTPRHIAIEVAIQQARVDTGVDLQRLAIGAPAMDNIALSALMLEPTDLAARLGLSSVASLNNALSTLGWQTRPQPGAAWVVTSAGAPHAQQHAWMNHGKTGYNYKWNVDVVQQALATHRLMPGAVSALSTQKGTR
jgi:hypothetical protein